MNWFHLVTVVLLSMGLYSSAKEHECNVYFFACVAGLINVAWRFA